jgi:serine protease
LCTTGTCGAGILDVPQALAYAEAVKNGGSYSPPARQAAMIDAAELRDAAAAGPDRPANTTTTTPPPSGGNSSGGGGGAMSAWWLAALGAAVLALRRRAVPS